jgi:amino acid transporter
LGRFDFEAIHNARVDAKNAFTLEDNLPTDAANLKSPLASLTATTTSSRKQKYRVLGTLSLIGVGYMSTAGGPVGSEQLISIGGPLVGLLGIACYFVLCQIPMSLVMTELCCAFPENGGFAVWAMAAFGPFWGFQVGYWAWIVSVINNAIYPDMIYQAVTQALGVEATSGFVAYLIKVAIAGLLALPSCLGTRFIGVASLVMMSIVILITLLFTTWGFAVGDGAFFRLLETRTLDGSSSDGDNVNWPLLIEWLFINFDRLQWISMIGGEIRNPSHTFPRMIFFTVTLGVLMYTLPFIGAVIADKTPWREIVNGSYPAVASAFGGPALHSIVTLSSIISIIGLFATSIFLQSFLIQGMAQSHLLPRIFRKRSTRFKAPKYALLSGLLTTMIVMGLSFDTMIDMTNAFSSAVQAMIVLSALQLRRLFPDLHRPMCVPVNLGALTVMLIAPFGIFVYTIGHTLVNWDAGFLAIACVVPGMLFPYIRTWFAGRQICG